MKASIYQQGKNVVFQRNIHLMISTIRRSNANAAKKGKYSDEIVGRDIY